MLSQALGAESMAFGSSAIAGATAGNSVAIGNGSNTAGGGSSAFGYGANATSTFAAALGANATASGDYSVAAGMNSVASLNKSVSIGFGVVANRESTVHVSNLSILSIPTASTGLPSGAVWSNAGVLNIVP
mgnify:FL=1